MTLAACAASTPPASTRVPAPAKLGATELLHLDGARVKLAGERGARPTLIALWATWCDTCTREFDALTRLAPKAAEQGAYVVAIAEGEPRDTVASFVRARDLRYPQLVDEDFSLGDALGVRAVPTTLVLDRGGRLVYRGGALDRAALVALDEAIANK